MCLGSLSLDSNSSSYLWYYLLPSWEKKFGLPEHHNASIAQGFSHPFEAVEIFSDSLHLEQPWHGYWELCLFVTVVLNCFLRFCFSFKLRRHKVLVVCEQVFHRTASAFQGRGYSGSKKSLGLPSKPKLKITSLKIWLSIRHKLFHCCRIILSSGGRKLPLYSAYGPFTLFKKNVLACPLTPENATARKRVFIIWF